MNTAPRLARAYMSGGTSLVLHTVMGAEPSASPTLSFYLTLYSFPGFTVGVLGHTGKAAVLVWFVVLAGLPLTPPQLSH